INLNIIVFIIGFFIYIYFLDLIYQRYKRNQKKENLLTLIATTLILIAGIILLYVEVTGDEVVPNEF
ncbi:MAG: hypothetical protein K2L98_01250, partial [Bacilli bacterium]|nr:hypothetical protein [Bacilli bacterium]